MIDYTGCYTEPPTFLKSSSTVSGQAAIYRDFHLEYPKI